MSLTPRDLDLLKGVHPALRAVIERAARDPNCPRFVITEGLRTLEQQRKNVAKKVSKTLKSRHLTGHAVDIAPLDPDTGKASYDWSLYYPLAKAIKRNAKELGTPIEWGGDWHSFKDGPHWQLPWKDYPENPAITERFPADYHKAPQYTGTTDRDVGTGTALKALSGGTVGAGIGAEPLAKMVDAVIQQQSEITSGDIVRVVLGGAIILASVYLAYRAFQQDS